MTTETVEDIKIDEKIKKIDAIPPKFKVVFLNDDSTPMEWVIELLMGLFKHTRDNAEKITLTIHSEGSGVVGVYSHEIAEQKAIEATNASRNKGFPLRIKIEKE